MDDARVVRVGEAARDLHGEVDGLGDRHWPARDAFFSVSPS